MFRLTASLTDSLSALTITLQVVPGLEDEKQHSSFLPESYSPYV